MTDDAKQDPALADTLASDHDAPADGTRLRRGTRLGAYRIDGLLGEGAMGEVYSGLHMKLLRPVAIKTLKPKAAADPTLVRRFFAEATAVNIIRHENIVECTDMVKEESGRAYIVMELLEGRTLGTAIKEAAGRMPAERAVRVAAQIADALGAAHANDIVHRDLKPENVFLIKRGGTRHYVKVLDFGIARLRPDLGVAASDGGVLIGTPAYMSPEQVRGDKITPAADIYALGIVLYQMLTGELPFSGSNAHTVLLKHLSEPAPKVDKVPAALSELVDRMLAKEIEDRPASMTDVRRLLFESLGLSFEPLTPTTSSTSATVQPPARRWLLATVAIAVVLAAGLVLLLIS